MDEESSDENGGDDEAAPRLPFRPSRACTGAGAASLLGCALLAAVGWPAGPPPQHDISARRLLESPELHETAADTIMAMDHGMLDSVDRAAVRDFVSVGFRNLTRLIGERSPEALASLDRLQLTPEQQGGVLRVVRKMSDPRLQELGAAAAHAARAGASGGPSSVRRSLLEKLQPRMAEIRLLQEEVIPAPLHTLGLRAGGEAGDWHVALDPESMTLVRSFSDEWHVEIDVSRPEVLPGSPGGRRLAEFNESGITVSKEQGVALLSALLEQARVIVDQLDRIAELFGSDKIPVHIPDYVRSMVAGGSFFSSLLSCVMDSAEQEDKMLMFMCPFRLASAGADVLHSTHVLEGSDRAMGWNETRKTTLPPESDNFFT